MASRSRPQEDAITIPPGLPGMLGVPAGAKAIVIFAHGSGSGRLSPRNRQVAGSLQRAGLATLLFDLLTEDEATDRRKVFDIDLLAGRLGGAVDVAGTRSATMGLPCGLFGASTGAAAALAAAAARPAAIGAVVARGGRPDLAGDAALGRVAAPTLLIVGGADREVIGLNAWARSRMGCVNELAIVPGAGHLFEEPGALERVGQLAAAWFLRWLAREADDGRL